MRHIHSPALPIVAFLLVACINNDPAAPFAFGHGGSGSGDDAAASAGGDGGLGEGGGGTTADSVSSSASGHVVGSGGNDATASVSSSASAPSAAATASSAASSTSGGIVAECAAAQVCVLFSDSAKAGASLCGDPDRYAYSCLDAPYVDCFEGVQVNGNGWPTWCCESDCAPLSGNTYPSCDCSIERPMQCYDYDVTPANCRDTAVPNGFCCDR